MCIACVTLCCCNTEMPTCCIESLVHTDTCLLHNVGERPGFFLGDGAGVGKGRQIAALIKEFFVTGGKRVLWVSTSNDLRFDARRDLADVGASDIQCFPDKKDAMPKGPLSQHISKGVVFVTYSLLVSKAGAGVKREKAAGKKAKEPTGQGMDFGPVPKGTRWVTAGLLLKGLRLSKAV